MIPAGLPGLDPRWSRQVHAPDAEGIQRQWHVLDNGPQLADRGEPIVGTVLCVHGNPTWSYLWRRVLQQAPPGWRVIAVDHLGMGYSDRLTASRTIAQRVDDLGRLTDALDVSGPVVPLAHDWGGPIALGWTLRRAAAHATATAKDTGLTIAGIVLTNTAVHQPEGQPKPTAITTTRSRPLLDLLTMRTPAFVAATTALSRPPLPKDVRRAFAAPYDSAAHRNSVRDFVADVPFESDHPSYATLNGIAAGVAELTVPALLVWGIKDPVFSSRYLVDLQSRLPHADVQVYPRASHLVLEDNPEGVEVIWSWITERFGHQTASVRDADAPADEPAVDLRDAQRISLEVRDSDPDTLAIVELGAGGAQITRGALAERVEDVARGLQARSVRSGQRVAVLIPPGIDLNTVVYAVWRLGAIVVVADAGLGLARLGAALRSTSPDHIIGIRAALLLTRATRVPGSRINAEPSAVHELVNRGKTAPPLLAETPGEDREAAILFTSGATGPPKGVVYTRGQLSSQVTTLRDAFDLQDGEGFVAAFAPFALYGPPLGLPCAVPDMDVTAPHTLTAVALAEAVASVKATAVFASPAALRNVVATAGDLSDAQRSALALPRLVMSAGAPVPPALLNQVKALMPAASTQTPYGMTEVLPVATIDPTTLDHVSPEAPEVGATSGGVCVGAPLAGVDVRIAPLADDALRVEEASRDELTDQPWVLGEIVVRAPHLKLRYHRAWAAQHASERPAGWHRTGDVGHLDDHGRLWVQGRRVHVLHTSDGPLAPYPIEHRISGLPGVADVAVVGVGPAGTAQCVAVVIPESRVRRADSPLADADLAAAVRGTAGVSIAAVLVKDWLPVDIRHASKVDRTGLATWAWTVLHGRSAQSPISRARAIVGRPGSAQPGTRSR
ncbi:MAG: alpha/beta fold hydrolase [Ornithinimicrobium sp.]